MNVSPKYIISVFFVILYCNVLTAQIVGSWSELGTGVTKQGDILTIAVDDIGNVYAGGYCLNPYGSSFIGKWDGTSWSELGGINSFAVAAGFTPTSRGVSNDCSQILIDHSGNLYAEGAMFDINGNPVILKWNGKNWSTIIGPNRAMALDGSGNLIAVSYDYSTHTTNVSKWNGTNWNILGTGTSALNLVSTSQSINSIVADDFGNVYAAGTLKDVNGKYYVTKWNGSTWSALGTGVNALNANGAINMLVLDNFGNLYAGGSFTNANGVYYVAKWDGSTWRELGTGVNALNADGMEYNGAIHSIVIDHRSGLLYAGGELLSRGYSVWQWNGTNWNEVGIGRGALQTSNFLYTIAVDKSSNVYAAGGFWDINQYFEVVKWTFTTSPPPITTTGTINPASKVSISIYPNPGTDKVYMEVPEAGQLTIYSISGTPIVSESIAQGNSYIDLNRLLPGMYTFVFAGQNDVYNPIKWVKE